MNYNEDKANASLGGCNADFPLRSVGGVPFAVTDPSNAVQWIVSQAETRGRGVNIRLANAWNIALANDDPGYGSLMRQPNCINLPDGTPVVWFLNMLRGNGVQARRTRGPSMFRNVLEQTADGSIGHFFLGGSIQTLEDLVERVKSIHPEIRIAGSYSPPFSPVDAEFVDDCLERIRDAKPDIVWVGLGTPKQDIVGTRLAALVRVPVINVGAAFDFVAGTVREAPVLVQRIGGEWLFRLISEPRRLGRRYIYGNVRFLIVALSGVISRKHAR